jgi:hypothetical protein
MQDLFRGAELSPGAVDSYFAGKDELIAAVIGVPAEILLTWSASSRVCLLRGVTRIYQREYVRSADASYLAASFFIGPVWEVCWSAGVVGA